ncbi:acyl carrier protein [Membranihabitans maritimus]|uniref:acyl carrier protein n=1 Tax=Membranihabitans maritimus TaxID=2904244 RepID=UPI001F250D71|nr:phosphopantetheine-binding protein [Membranihabitans maritimus]
MSNIKEDIRKIFRAEVDKRVNIQEIKDDESITEFGVDSLDKSSVFLEIEDHFGVEIPDTEIENLDTIDDILKFINENK